MFQFWGNTQGCLRITAFSNYSWQCSGCQNVNLGLLHARQVSYPAVPKNNILYVCIYLILFWSHSQWCSLDLLLALCSRISLRGSGELNVVLGIEPRSCMQGKQCSSVQLLWPQDNILYNYFKWRRATKETVSFDIFMS